VAPRVSDEPSLFAGGDALTVEDAFTIPVTELTEAWTAALPAIFG
jgi:hypothetical protein